MTTKQLRDMDAESLIEANADPFHKEADKIRAEVAERLRTGQGLRLAFDKINATRTEYERETGMASYQSDASGLPAGRSDAYLLWLERRAAVAGELAAALKSTLQDYEDCDASGQVFDIWRSNIDQSKAALAAWGEVTEKGQ
jgi:hypothetical protein